MRRIPMHKIKEVLKLKYQNNLSNRQIQTMIGVSKSSVANYIKIYKMLESELTEVLSLSHKDLEDLFHPKKSTYGSKHKIDHPNWNSIREELTQKGMTKKLLWEELKESNPNLYSYSQFNRYYNQYIKTVNPSMRQIHYGGDKLFVDYSGLTMPISNAKTGEITKAQIFVSVLGSSGYTFVHATPSQTTKDFIQSHVEAFQFYEGVPNIAVPDNLKAAVILHKRGRVKLNESYAHMGSHYGIAIEPARPRKPQDKSKAELGVKGVQRWILMKLRHHTFFSVDELNEQINGLIDGYNNKIIRRLGKSRTQLFEQLDKPYLKPLPANKYIFKTFKQATVGVDYHVELEGSGYSVPYQYLGKRVDIMYSSTSVVISLNGEVIAHHPKMNEPYNDSTLIEHMPLEHQYQYEKWNPRRILNWASSIGIHTLTFIETLMNKKQHKTRSYKACMAILSFSKKYSNHELEMVCEVALKLNMFKVSSIESMLKTKSYISSYTSNYANEPFMDYHENIRGSDYYSTLNHLVCTGVNS